MMSKYSESSHYRESILNDVSAALQRDAELASPTRLSAEQITNAFSKLVSADGKTDELSEKNWDASDNRSKAVRFTTAAEASNSIVEELDSVKDIPAWLKRLKGDSQQAVYIAQHDLFSDLNWSQQNDLDITEDYKKINQWGLIPAVCAIAETGSIVLTSSDKHAIASGFLLDVMVVMVHKSQIVDHLEDIWPFLESKSVTDKLKAQSRTVNIITGPSRTADVEQKVQLGAHGPRQLIIGLLP